MSSITNLVPIRIDAFSSDRSVRIVDSFIIDTTCLPVSHAVQTHDSGSLVAPGGLSLIAAGGEKKGYSDFSLESLVDSNAIYLTESILADAEVSGTAKSSKNYSSGRLELLSDGKLYREIKHQIQTQLVIALTVEKDKLISGGAMKVHEEFQADVCLSSNAASVQKQEPTPDGAVSSDRGALKRNDNQLDEAKGMADDLCSNNVRIRLRLRQENIAVVDEFNYDINSSGLEGGCPLALANSIVQDLNLPLEFAPSIATSIVEQIYGISVKENLDDLDSKDAKREVPAAFVLDAARQGSSSEIAKYLLDCQ